MIKGIKFASISVRDQDQALAFYTERLGFAIATDQPYRDGHRWIELRIPGAETRLVLFASEGEANGSGSLANVTFMTDDVERTYEELKSRGVAFTSAPKTAPWGSYAIFKDSEENTFVLSSR